MPSLETPPSPAEQPNPPSPPVRVRTGRYGELDEHEIIHLLTALDDERARARFREAIYISVIFYLAVVWLLFYGPRILFHQPKLISPVDVLKQRDKELTYLDMPKDVAKDLRHKPTNVMSDKDRTQQTTKPTLDKKTLEQLQAMQKAGTPELPPTPQPPQPTQQQSAPQQQQTQQQQQQLPDRPQPQQQQQAMIDAPRPMPKVNFGPQGQSAGESIRQAAQGAARGGGGNFGQNAPVSHDGMNTGVDVLSDTQGVDFGPYLRRILSDIKRNWEPLIPEEARPPLNKQGETLIRFVILPDGHIGAMHLDDSTHDDAINRACWSAITSEGQFPPLPKEFHGPQLELRLHFLTNMPLP
jgi:outer membrane biosynthesis protein TonB